MKNKILGVDLDEVLAELVDYVLEYNNHKIGNHDLKRNDIKDYYIYKMDHIDITLEFAIEWFKQPILSDIGNHKIPVIKGAKDKLLKLKESGHSLVIVTARTEDLFGDYTRVWIDIHYPNIFDDIIFANHFNKQCKEKSQICLENGIQHMIEDNYDYATNLAEAGIKTFLLEKPWNNWQKEYHDNIIRIKSWEEVNL